MIIYLSSFNRGDLTEIPDCYWNRVNGLLSFELLNKEGVSYIPKLKRFMLDSGAFSFIIRKLKNKNKKQEIDWDAYIDRYCNFVVEHNVEHFFELDIDFLVGYDKVKEFRKQIIQKTGKLPIPVWHITRGKADFERMCDEFPYVALGGMISKENNTAVDLELMAWLVNEAHRRGAKIHGLGFTKPVYLPYIHFDSVDSSTHAKQAVYGILNYFDGTTLKSLGIKRKMDMTQKEFMLNNFKVWIEYSEYAESHY